MSYVNFEYNVYTQAIRRCEATLLYTYETLKSTSADIVPELCFIDIQTLGNDKIMHLGGDKIENLLHHHSGSNAQVYVLMERKS